MAAYLETEILSLFLHANLVTGNKLLWIKEEIAPKKKFLPFPQYCSGCLISGVRLYFHLGKMDFCPHFCKSDMSKFGYLEVFQRGPLSLIVQ